MKTFKLSSTLTLLASLCLGGSLSAGCGGSSAPAETPAESTTAETAPETSAEASEAEVASADTKSFDDMSAPEKMSHMKTVVMPHMAKVFQEADPEEYADFSCTNCHGPGAKQGDFTMPSAALPALNKEEMDEHPEITKFMMERVTPEMVKLLGEEPYNMDTGEGFGCFGCHTKKE